MAGVFDDVAYLFGSFYEHMHDDAPLYERFCRSNQFAGYGGQRRTYARRNRDGTKGGRLIGDVRKHERTGLREGAIARTSRGNRIFHYVNR